MWATNVNIIYFRTFQKQYLYSNMHFVYNSSDSTKTYLQVG